MAGANSHVVADLNCCTCQNYINIFIYNVLIIPLQSEFTGGMRSCYGGWLVVCVKMFMEWTASSVSDRVNTFWKLVINCYIQCRFAWQTSSVALLTDYGVMCPWQWAWMHTCVCTCVCGGEGGVGVWVDAHLITYSDTCSCGHAVVFAIYCTNTFSGSGGRLPREARLYPVSVRQELHCQDYRRYEGHEEEPHRHRGEYSGTL